MPIGLAGFFIQFLTDENDLVLDPFAGSNTTGQAAEALGRRWIAVEPNADYIEGSKGRFVSDEDLLALEAELEKLSQDTSVTSPDEGQNLKL
jgi:site-specific DNA-methyltransferase (cytosine-N4-specific)